MILNSYKILDCEEEKNTKTFFCTWQARYYDTEQGRFISRDPAGYIDGLGLYNGYFATRFMMDPSGKATENCPDEEFGAYGPASVGILTGQGSILIGGMNDENEINCNYSQERNRTRTCCTEEFGLLVDVETQRRRGAITLEAGSTCPTRPPSSIIWGVWQNIQQ